MKYFIVVGERSGDMHAANLVGQLKILDRRGEFMAFGGHLLATEGVKILQDYEKYSFMGVWDVLKNLWKIKKILYQAKKAILTEQPDVLILIDFPGFNLKLAKFAKENNINVAYYISPKVWVWNESRVRKIEKYVDQMLVIFPFEVDFYKQRGVEVTYVGNPILESIRSYDFEENFLREKDWNISIAVLLGSRVQEIQSASEVLLKVMEEKPNYHFLIAAVDNIPSSYYQPFQERENVSIHYNKTYDILKKSNAAIVTSGTATLETALLNVPQLVVYKTNFLTYFLVKMVIKIKWISLVNILVNSTIVKELIQKKFTHQGVIEEMDKILGSKKYCAEMLTNYQELREKLGGERASKTVAREIYDRIKSQLS